MTTSEIEQAAREKATELVWSWRGNGTDDDTAFWDKVGREKYFSFIDVQQQVSSIADALAELMAEIERLRVFEAAMNTPQPGTEQNLLFSLRGAKEELMLMKAELAALKAELRKDAGYDPKRLGREESPFTRCMKCGRDRGCGCGRQYRF